MKKLAFATVLAAAAATLFSCGDSSSESATGPSSQGATLNGSEAQIVGSWALKKGPSDSGGVTALANHTYTLSGKLDAATATSSGYKYVKMAGTWSASGDKLYSTPTTMQVSADGKTWSPMPMETMGTDTATFFMMGTNQMIQLEKNDAGGIDTSIYEKSTLTF